MSNKSHTCCICLDDIKDDIKFLECLHGFHTNCIDIWSNLNPSCPLCKHAIKQSPDKRRHDQLQVPQSAIYDLALGAIRSLIYNACPSFDVNMSVNFDVPLPVRRRLVFESSNQVLANPNYIPSNSDLNLVLHMLNGLDE